MHHAYETGDMKQGQDSQAHHFRRAIDPERRRHCVVHDARVRQHAAFGQPRCAAGIGKERQIIPVCNQSRQFIVHLKDIPPVVDITMRQARQ
jgi:hypothetical protein